MSEVTIAIPFYNAQKYLKEAIDSVLWQTYTNWQLLLVDDGSTDDSLQLAKEYEQRDKRIKVYSDGKNKNLGYRLNQIPELCETKYLARMDADDVMHPQKLEEQLKVLKTHEDIDVLGTNAYTIDEDSNVVGLRFDFESITGIISVNDFIHPTIMAKTEWFKKNPYDVKAERIEDLELWRRTNFKSNFKMLSKPLFFYREFSGNYYKKYRAAQKTKKYILNKYPNNIFWIKYFKKNYIKSNIYYFFSLFNFEGYLIVRRNKVILDKKINIDDLINKVH